MKAVGVLGTSSGAGKSWIATALCAWLRGQGVKVAPFKAQNMSNNAWVTPEGGEMARAQAVQAEACGLAPSVEMNPILLKPSGTLGAQLIRFGKAESHQTGKEYYAGFEAGWRTVRAALDGWRDRCEVLVLEGAGSPVELNLAAHDLVNLRPLRHVDGRALLVGDIDRGGIFAQLAGTWQLFGQEDRGRFLGAIANRFRGDLSLFSDPNRWLRPHAPGLELLGTVPYRPDLQPDEEDGLSTDDADRGQGETIAWVRLPHVANLTDCQPWWADQGVRTRWIGSPGQLADARAVVLPGTKNTLADLRWLRKEGWDRAIVAAAKRGVPVVGICGGYQILGEALSDPDGVAGDAGEEIGLGLLPIRTRFERDKLVHRVTVRHGGRAWEGYEIHMGRSGRTREHPALTEVCDRDGRRPEGSRVGNVWGTYVHGWFDAPETRRELAQAAGIAAHGTAAETAAERRQAVYRAMAGHLAAHVDLSPVRRYLGL